MRRWASLGRARSAGPRRRKPRDERGAVALLTVLLLALLMTMCAFVVDIGMQRVGRADVQALADVVALDVVRELGGKTVTELEPLVATALAASVARNRDVLGAGEPEVTLELGELQVDGAFAPMTSGVPTAVRVTASTTVDFAFSGITGTDSGRATRRAVANAVRSACYSVGSYAASADTTTSPVLDPLLDKLAEQTGAFSNGYGVGQVIGYQGLASASVRLGDVATALGFGSVTDLADARVDLKDYYGAVQAAIGPGNEVAVAMLRTMASSANRGRSLEMSSILGIDSGSGALAELRANVLDLVLGSLYAINGTNAVDLYLNNALGRFGYLGVTVKVIQGPHLYCGQPGSQFTTGSGPQTEQIRISGQGNLSPTTVSTPIAAIPGVTTVASTLTAPMWSTMPFSLSVASTESTLTAVRCGSASGIDVSIANHLARLTLTGIQYSEASFDTSIKVAGVSVEAKVTVGSANANVSVGFGADATVRFGIDVPPMALDTPYPTQTEGGVTPIARLNGKPSVRVQAKVGVGPIHAGADISGLLSADALTSIAQTVVDTVNRAAFDVKDPNSLTNRVIAPLLSLGGLRLAGSDVILHSQPPMDCGRPALRG